MAGREGIRTPLGVRGDGFAFDNPNGIHVHYNTQVLMVSCFFARRPTACDTTHGIPHRYQALQP